MTYWPVVIYFVFALVVSFLCSLLEATLLSVSPAHVEVMVGEGRRSGRLLKAYKKRIDRPLIAILTTNTVANMFGAAGVGAEAAGIARHKGMDESLWVGVASGVLTLAILICAEIVPKTLGAVYWKSLAPVSAHMLRVLMIVLMPVVIALEGIPKLLAGNAAVGHVSGKEISALAAAAHRAGSIKGREGEVISNLFGLDTIHAKDIMTPRVAVFALDKSDTIDNVMEMGQRIRHARIPVYGENIDEVLGIALRYDIVDASRKGEGSRRVEGFLRPVHFVPETQTLSQLLETFVAERSHLFVVVNEYGGTEGVVTLEDVMETLLGVEIVDELDEVADLQKRAIERHKLRERLRGNDS